MSEYLTTVTAALKERFGAQDAECKVQPSLFIAPEQIAQVLQALRDEFGYDFLASLTASDYWPEEQPRFHVVYQLAALKLNERLCLRVPVNGDNPNLPTVEKIYPVANWHERELWDMFGIRFDGHSDMRRILMPYDWVGHPLRKDYPLGYEEPQFTFNYEDIQVRKHSGRYEEA
jgi:NADH-quinone oxidoreductase subunit C